VASKKVVKNSTIHVTRTIGKANELPEPSHDDAVIAVHQFQTQPAEVAVEYKLVMNLGNYEAAHLGVTVKVPCYKEELDDAYDFAAAWAEDRLNAEKKKISGDDEATL